MSVSLFSQIRKTADPPSNTGLRNEMRWLEWLAGVCRNSGSGFLVTSHVGAEIGQTIRVGELTVVRIPEELAIVASCGPLYIFVLVLLVCCKISPKPCSEDSGPLNVRDKRPVICLISSVNALGCHNENETVGPADGDSQYHICLLVVLLALLPWQPGSTNIPSEVALKSLQAWLRA